MTGVQTCALPIYVFPNDYRQAVSAINKGEPLAATGDGALAQSFQEFARALTGGREVRAAQSAGGGLLGWLTPKRAISS